MTLDIGASYIMQTDRNMTNQGVYSTRWFRPTSSRAARMGTHAALRTVRPPRKIYTELGAVGRDYAMQNPYWINYRNLRENDRKRYMIKRRTPYKILDWLSVSGRIRIDNAVNNYTEKYYASSDTDHHRGIEQRSLRVKPPQDQQSYGDLLVNIDKSFGDDWTLKANIGALVLEDVAGCLMSAARSATTESLTCSTSSNWTTPPRNAQAGWREQYQSVFASAEVGYKGTYYLTLTGRNDWPSQLAGPKSVKTFVLLSFGRCIGGPLATDSQHA